MEGNLPEIDPAQEPTQPGKKRSAWIGFTWEILQTLIMAVILYFLIDTVVGRVRVENISMQPTLHEGEFVLVNKLAYRLGSFHLGDIVVFHYPRNPAGRLHQARDWPSRRYYPDWEWRGGSQRADFG